MYLHQYLNLTLIRFQQLKGLKGLKGRDARGGVRRLGSGFGSPAGDIRWLLRERRSPLAEAGGGAGMKALLVL